VVYIFMRALSLPPVHECGQHTWHEAQVKWIGQICLGKTLMVYMWLVSVDNLRLPCRLFYIVFNRVYSTYMLL